MTTTLATIDPLLAGFESVPSDGLPFITLDSQRRFYLNASLRKLVGVKAYDRVALAYNPSEHTIALLTGDTASVLSSTSYFVDKRHYMSARRFIADYRYDIEQGPYTFEFQRSGSVDGVFMFKLATAAGSATPQQTTKAQQELPSETGTSVTLMSDHRLHFSDKANCVLYVGYRTSPRQIEVSTELSWDRTEIHVDEHGMTEPVPKLHKIYAKTRPATFRFTAIKDEDTLVFRKGK